MSNYLSSNLRYLTSTLDKLRSTLEFNFNLVPEDIPFNVGYGVRIPKDIKVDDFCKSYETNLKSTFKVLGLDITIDSVDVSGSNLIVKLKYNDKIETWSLQL